MDDSLLNYQGDLRMIYQRTNKITIAAWFDLPLATYFDYSFNDYLLAHERMDKYIELMHIHIHAVEDFHETDLSKEPFFKWKYLFDEWASEVGQELPKPYLIGETA